MITRIRNASLVKARTVYILKSNITISISQILKDEGFIQSFEFVKFSGLSKKFFLKEFILLTLKFKGFYERPYINCLKRISKPGVRVFVSSSNIPKILGGIGIAVLFFYYVFAF